MEKRGYESQSTLRGRSKTILFGGLLVLGAATGAVAHAAAEQGIPCDPVIDPGCKPGDTLPPKGTTTTVPVETTTTVPETTTSRPPETTTTVPVETTTTHPNIVTTITTVPGVTVNTVPPTEVPTPTVPATQPKPALTQ